MGAQKISLSEAVGVAHFESDVELTLRRPRVSREKMEAGQRKRAAILQKRVIAVADIQNVVDNVFLHHKPWAPAQPRSFTLSDGVKPVSAMLANLFAGFNLNDRSHLFAQDKPHKVAIINLTLEANSLSVLSTCRRQRGFQRNASHFVLHEVADGQHDFVH